MKGEVEADSVKNFKKCDWDDLPKESEAAHTVAHPLVRKAASANSVEPTGFVLLEVEHFCSRPPAFASYLESAW